MESTQNRIYFELGLELSPELNNDVAQLIHIYTELYLISVSMNVFLWVFNFSYSYLMIKNQSVAVSIKKVYQITSKMHIFF